MPFLQFSPLKMTAQHKLTIAIKCPILMLQLACIAIPTYNKLEILEKAYKPPFLCGQSQIHTKFLGGIGT